MKSIPKNGTIEEYRLIKKSPHEKKCIKYMCILLLFQKIS